MARTRIRPTVLTTAVALSALLPASAWASPLQPIVSSNVDGNSYGRCMVAVRPEVVPQDGTTHYVAPPLGTETTMAPCPRPGALAGIRREHIWTTNPNGEVRSVDGMCLDVDISRPLTDGTRVQVWTCTGGDNQSWFLQPGTNNLRSRVTSNLRWCLTALGARASLVTCTGDLASAQSWFVGLG
jgi:hypothetical protein